MTVLTYILSVFPYSEEGAEAVMLVTTKCPFCSSDSEGPSPCLGTSLEKRYLVCDGVSQVNFIGETITHGFEKQRSKR